VLGPLVFIIYTNDLPNSINNAKTIQFADDITLYYANKGIDALYKIISQELSCLSDWLRANNLLLNVSKNNYILFSNTDSKLSYLPEITLANRVISQAEFVKFLGHT
jgi:hypothetical protein